MRLSTYALVALAAFGSFVASESAMGQELQASVALDALGTARQLVGEGRLQDALHIAYLVQRLPDLTDNESERCRSLLAQCQSLAISMYIEQGQADERRIADAYGTRQSSGSAEFGEADGDGAVQEFSRDVAGTSPDNALQLSALHGSDEAFSQPGEFVSRVPRLLNEHSENESPVFQPCLDLSSSDQLSFEEGANGNRITAGGLAANVQHEPQVLSVDVPANVSSQPAWVRIAGIWMPVLLGLMAGWAGRELIRVGRLVLQMGCRYLHRLALGGMNLRGKSSLGPPAQAKSDGGFSEICARIADDNRRLR